MKKARLEAFSDGVFAIAITLLVLNIEIPEVDHNHLSEAVIAIAPKLLSYVLSFLLIGLYWIGHHFYLEHIEKVDGNLVWLNIMLLLFICLMPFPTSLLGKYPLQQLSLMLYGLNLLAANFIGIAMVYYIHKNRHLTNQDYKNNFLKLQIPGFLFINVTYIIAIAFSWFYPVVSYSLYLLVMFAGIKIFVKRLNNR
ncbi:MAG TPA: TMEM175 family protein [Chitinophagaceae bacterium]|nr:TMEM175 family protein [Chitinophagaceae bacterium]